MYVESVPNRNSPPAILLRESYREEGKVKKRTLANLSDWPAQLIEHFKVLLRGGVAVANTEDLLEIERSLPHGHVAAVLGCARQCGLDECFAAAPLRLRPLLLALVVARVIEPASKLATHRMLRPTPQSFARRVLGVGQVRREDLYQALDWLARRSWPSERRLARQHLAGSDLVLYDLTSTWLTGQCARWPRAAFARRRAMIRRSSSADLHAIGCPVAVQVFEGNTADPSTVAAQVAKLKQRFGIERIAWVGDRGMLTSARIDEVLRPQAMDWVSSLRAPQIAQLAAAHGPFQPSLFDQRNLLEVTSAQFPGERLIVCLNPWLAAERARKREELLAATETELAKIAAATTRRRRPLRGEQAIALRVGAINRFRMAKH
jgi:hypothetical protein